MTNNLNKRLNEVLEKLHYLEQVIRNLKERDGTLITDVEEIDERLFREIAEYETLTEELKRDFLMLLMQDAESMAVACMRNINSFSKISEEFDKMEKLLDFIRKHEEKDIRNSKELQRLALEAKAKLKGIRQNMSSKVMENQEEQREYEKVQNVQRKIK